MTDALEPEQAAAYVRELSADVAGVVVLDRRGNLLAGEEALAAAARRLPAQTATYVTKAGTVWVATGATRSVVAAARRTATRAPTALDIAVAAGAQTPALAETSPGAALRSAVEDVLEAT